ncbi:hypothetical protein Kpol_1018p72 [Vanderwaltozyma polyspora DSM 70294]|uniref:Zinc finger PHD-type domain-containing protein n=1 Tax=Vanderwaltozyma polyspora (strain ATCC 22028 / DSM 70294 / BCRC 21397 / CBS 2163 / NBRC 10782 / NRRL Y-8283 / UCD 57-17) TaxID=436907 RepID=A7TDS0_VANPO|nr:uncharacterized protein Kpol_1018p72 [Vanderwaltozyma polyspora DSM 70294]EDO19540.1 hypothetical protein Kpol_1018p72 [Vanderwaltozyma polyspora DSM 70294]
MDIRYSFLGTLDHFPCELIRTLWTIQSLDLSEQQKLEDRKNNGDNGDDNDGDRVALHMMSQAEFLNNLVDDQIQRLERQKEELLELHEIRGRFETLMRKKEGGVSDESTAHKEQTGTDTKKRPRLLIKLNLKKYKKVQIQEKKADKIVVEEKVVEAPKIVPLEPTYCICKDVSYGQMVACDNPNCPTEWFHYSCVGIVRTPVGKWYCSEECKLATSIKPKRSSRSNVQRVKKIKHKRWTRKPARQC